ncbi:MAG: ABC transporter substrate-binding protein [Planctomycetia bacterium]|nr:ABC transporter substrate-binding protein [Planctomycetia bacterium]
MNQRPEKKWCASRFLPIFALVCLATFGGCGEVELQNETTQNETAPAESAEKFLCDSAGCLRLVVYLGCADRVVGVEQIEKDDSQMVPYRIATPHLRDLPTTGESHGRQNVEAILSLKERPAWILRSRNTGAGLDSSLLESRTGIPVVEFLYGDLGENRQTLYASLRELGARLGVEQRAESVIAFVEENIREIQSRCPTLPQAQRPSVFLGGLSYRGAHGFSSTSASYPPFEWTKANNVVRDETLGTLPAQQMMVTREQILLWNPETIFLDLGTVGVQKANGIQELQTDPIYQRLDAVKNGRVFALYPNSSYHENLEARLANAWFIGKVLYPDAFEDVDVDAKVREIFQFLTGSPVLDDAAEVLRNQAFRPIILRGEG